MNHVDLGEQWKTTLDAVFGTMKNEKVQNVHLLANINVDRAEKEPTAQCPKKGGSTRVPHS